MRAGVGDIAGYMGMWRDFVPALAANREPRFSFDLARRDLVLTEAVDRSLGRDRSVPGLTA